MNYKRKSRRLFLLLMRSRTPPISLEFRGGGFEPPKPPPSVRHCCALGLARESTSHYEYKFSRKQRKRFHFLSCGLSTAAGSRSRKRWILMSAEDILPFRVTNVSRFCLKTRQFFNTRLQVASTTLYSRHSRDIPHHYRLRPHCIWDAYSLI